MGGILYIYGVDRDGDRTPEHQRAVSRVREVIRLINPSVSVVGYNDTTGRTRLEILAVAKKAKI